MNSPAQISKKLKLLSVSKYREGYEIVGVSDDSFPNGGYYTARKNGEYVPFKSFNKAKDVKLFLFNSGRTKK